MPRTRSQTAALLAHQITELAMGDMTITNTSKKHKTPPNKQNTPKKKKKRRKRGSSLSMRKKPTNTKGRGDFSPDFTEFTSYHLDHTLQAMDLKTILMLQHGDPPSGAH
eukprot:343252_1